MDRLLPLPPRDYRPALARLERETAARYRDHSTAQTFELRGNRPAVYEPSALFELEAQAERGPVPITGQESLL
jgi:hypothetical protein